jgi:hypothetical protein
MKISKKTYCYWLKKNLIAVETPKNYPKKRIKVVFEQSREIYGSYRIQKKLEQEGLFIVDTT